MSEYVTLLQTAILDEDNFVKATLSGQQHGQTNRWQKCVIRPVLLKNGRHLQFSFFDQTKNIVKNYAGEEAAQQTAEALALPFRNFHVQTQNEMIQVNLTKKGKAIVKRTEAEREIPLQLAHDRPKNTILSEGDDVPFLRAIGLMRADGRIKADRRSKFQQINAFLQMLSEIDEMEQLAEPIRMVDFGCGNAYLTFAAYHYLHHILDKQALIVGIDRQPSLIARNQQIASELGWDGLTFNQGLIGSYQTDKPPDIVMALHACDTATDDAIAYGIRCQSQVIIMAPCCHHHLQVQLGERPSPPEFVPVLRYGLFHERLGDILTDAFRAAILRIMGYQVTVMQFVSPEHTPKNLLLRAVRKGEPGHGPSVAEYLTMKAYWQVTPYLHQLLASELNPVLATK
jgi:SAM-dependent methyltransferase